MSCKKNYYMDPCLFLPSGLVYCGLRCKVSELYEEAMSACQFGGCTRVTFAPYDAILACPDRETDNDMHR